RPGLLGERRSLHAGGDEDERAGGRVHLLPVEFEARAAPVDEVEVLVRVVLQVLGSQVSRLAREFVVLVEDPVTCVSARPRADTKRRDAEVLSNGPPRTATI